MSRFFSQKYKDLIPYVPGEQPKGTEYVKLNTNESPYPPSEKAVALAREEAEKLNLYPDPTCSNLVSAVAKTYGVKENQVILGNGSDEILNYIFLAYCDKDNGAVFPKISYGFYSVQADLCAIPYKKIPLKADFSIDIKDYYEAGATVFIANPNAPTGLVLSVREISKILKNNPNNIVVVDEAYVDFGGESCVKLIDKFENLIVVQTFSKSRSMAGARLGMAFANEGLISDLNAIKYCINPYNINRMTMASGIGVMADQEYTLANCREIIKTRSWAEKELGKLGFEYTDSSANFIFAKHQKISGKTVYERLKEKGVLVRHFNTEEIVDYNRITVGTKEQMQRLIDCLKEIVEER